MKILKRAEQKNIILNKEYYNLEEINKMLDDKIICYFVDDFTPCYNRVYSINDYTFRIFTEDAKEIKVVLDNYNCYTNIILHNNGNKYYVTLD